MNIDDSAGARLVEDLPGDVLTVGGEGRLTIEGYEPAGSGTRVELSTPWGPIEGVAPVFGSFNVSNLAIAIGCCLISGIEIDDVKSAITNLEPVPGRFELVSGDDPIRVVVDYAHTPAGITHAIAAARSLTSDRVVAVVGAGGDRDRDKRPLMGAAASEADAVVITTDNPRSEEPARIAEDVRLGVPEGTPVVLELDRATAVERAVATGSDGDLVLVLGRGHEPYQEAKGSFVPLDDRDLARRALGRRVDIPRIPTTIQGACCRDLPIDRCGSSTLCLDSRHPLRNPGLSPTRDGPVHPGGVDGSRPQARHSDDGWGRVRRSSNRRVGPRPLEDLVSGRRIWVRAERLQLWGNPGRSGACGDGRRRVHR